MGAWLSYGLGSMNETCQLRGTEFTDAARTDLQPISPKLWSSGFLSNEYAGVAFRSQGEPVLYLGDPSGMSRETRRTLIDTVNAINQMTFEEVGDPETHARIHQYEMAFRMQTSLPELTNMEDEPDSTWTLYAMKQNRRARLRTTACWRDGWPSAGSALRKYISADGMCTRMPSAICPNFARRRIALRTHWSRIWVAAASG